ncbi:MAG: SGNH/GDSL hydrolase family protein [Candidatus Omnitrophica bacterium]|nr:SGNH/GDSL hydrolase family protein [Candidatus Omnitrophota bacterium]
MKKIFFWILLILCFFFAVEGMSRLSLFLLNKIKSVNYAPRSFALSEKSKANLQGILKGKKSYLMHHPSLGWTIRPGGVQGHHHANSQGIRSDQEYSLEPEAGKIRVAAFGDSYTHGDDVPGADTWEEKLAAMDPRFEVLNFGVGGYGFDQAFLRYTEDGIRFNPTIVLIGFMSENIHRVVNTFRLFYFPESGFALSKPRFILRGEDLILRENPLSRLEDYEALLKQEAMILNRLGTHDFYFKRSYLAGPYDFLATVRLFKIVRHRIHSRFRKDEILTDGVYNPHSEALEITLKLFDRFYEEVLNHGAVPLIVLFPNEGDIRDYKRTGRKIYGELIRHFDEKKYRYADLLEAFIPALEDHPVEEFFGATHHYTVLGNEVAARYLLKKLLHFMILWPK